MYLPPKGMLAADGGQQSRPDRRCLVVRKRAPGSLCCCLRASQAAIASLP